MSLLKKISKDEARYLNEHGCRKFMKHTFGKSKKKTYYVVECLQVEKVLNKYDNDSKKFIDMDIKINRCKDYVNSDEGNEDSD